MLELAEVERVLATSVAERERFRVVLKEATFVAAYGGCGPDAMMIATDQRRRHDRVLQELRSALGNVRRAILISEGKE